MNRWGLSQKISRVPVLGGILSLFSMLRDIYDTIGWTDPSYHSIRSSSERLEEARRVGAIGNPVTQTDPEAGRDAAE